MRRGKDLSEFEKGQILALRSENINIFEILRRLQRGRSCISKFLGNPSKHASHKRTGRKNIFSDREKRRICGEINKSTPSATKIKSNLNLEKGSIRTIQRVLKNSGHLVFTKRKVRPHLKANHVTGRLKWAEDHVTWEANPSKWRTVIFSNEKKFNLDGPDGMRTYWHGLRKEPKYFSKRPFGGGSLMVWAAFGYNGKTNIVFLEGRSKAVDYQNILKMHLLPFGEQIGGPFLIFQQDLAAIHNAKSTHEWFLVNGVNVMEWAAKSPDMNPMENLWGILVRSVYASGRQFDTKEELKEAIINSWEEITEETLRNLVRSRHRRVLTFIKAKGHFTYKKF